MEAFVGARKWNERGLATADSPVALRFAWPGRQKENTKLFVIPASCRNLNESFGLVKF
jgi:hypothetical protein